MRIGFISALCFSLLFALLIAPCATLYAQDGAPAMQASNLAGSHAGDGQPAPPFDPLPADSVEPALPDPTGVFSGSAAVVSPGIAPANLPPVLVGQNGGETIMIASDQSGDPVSVIKFTPGLDNPLQPAQQVETVIDLGFGLNARMTWNSAGNLFTFSFVP